MLGTKARDMLMGLLRHNVTLMLILCWTQNRVQDAQMLFMESNQFS